MKSADDREEIPLREALRRASGPERKAFLDQACEGNQALRGMLEALLQAHVEIRKTRYAVTGCFCLLVLALLVWRLAVDGLHPTRLFWAPDFPNGGPALDSFSEASLALALLQQEAEHLMLAYTQTRDQPEASQSAPSHDNTAIGSRARPASVSTSPAALDRPAALELSAVKPIAKLHAGVQDLEIDLDRKLMVAYYQNGSWNEFVDCYLRLVQQTPERPGAAALAASALECAQKCGRAEEVADALHHVTRFHPSLHSAQALRTVLEQWKPPPPDPEASKR